MKSLKIYLAVVFTFLGAATLLESSVFGGNASVVVIENESAASGSELYTQNCASCHGADGRGQTDKGREYSTPDISTARFHRRHSDAKISKAISKGGSGMPAFGKKLSQNEIGELVKFVRSLKK